MSVCVVKDSGGMLLIMYVLKSSGKGMDFMELI